MSFSHGLSLSKANQDNDGHSDRSVQVSVSRVVHFAVAEDAQGHQILITVRPSIFDTDWRDVMHCRDESALSVANIVDPTNSHITTLRDQRYASTSKFSHINQSATTATKWLFAHHAGTMAFGSF
ncbi:MAG: hypothetical protein AAF745_17850 [Planctomycetota bacterium]